MTTHYPCCPHCGNGGLGHDIPCFDPECPGAVESK